MKKFDDPCFYCEKYDPDIKCGKYIFFFSFVSCKKRWKKLLWTVWLCFRIIIVLAIYALVIYGMIKLVESERSQEKHDYLEAAHILIEGDESIVDINLVKFIEKAGFKINKIIVNDYDDFIFEIERKNIKYMWIIKGHSTTVFPLLEDKNKY